MSPSSTDTLEIIREEQLTPADSNILHQEKADDAQDLVQACPCKGRIIHDLEEKHHKEIQKLLKEKEEALTADFQERLEKEIKLLKDRFDYILQNEQIRTSHMMREAHRERKEKISALQTQLECKNLAGLMFVMCSERRKSKLEKLRIVEDYTKYINALQHILSESQELILNLSRGYKTAARVDHEWKNKMNKVIKEFQNFVYHYAGGTPETNQYFFDLPSLMKTKAPIQDDPKEDPCEIEEKSEEETDVPHEKNWWEMLDGENPPFIIFGDMAEFQPPQRREVLKNVKAAKTAPPKWKDYVFSDMFLHSNCLHLDTIKDEYVKHQPTGAKWECQNVQTERQSFRFGSDISHHRPTASVDVRGTMGSILKIITSSVLPQAITKATLLGARDSMEIASTTRLRERHRQSTEPAKVVLNVGKRIDSLFSEMNEEDHDEELHSKESSKVEDEENAEESVSALGSLHNDSMDMIATHVPDKDHTIHYEKTCPMEKCQRMKMDSFIRTLPPYMHANPFTHFEQTFDEYEPCTPEQLEILKKRIEEKTKKEKVDFDITEDNLSDWPNPIDGIAVQTSDISLSLPPCTCRDGEQSGSSVSSIQNVFNLADLLPVKEKLDKINQECFYHDGIDFKRFEVIGQDSEHKVELNESTFAEDRVAQIKKILKHHPSLCEIFQANIR
ncbi:uncharacterized protein LOC123702701 [Colias croceus]|uniref:uncharacterized protein LOC123702701 n=1 Tax=Colias crocea TaxID=72248 RepID=UPI001E27BDAC|nr:uncharacterized protein LOC123702701 [Colias croceus]